MTSVAFQLVIAEGKEAGREFVFEQASVVIGRTSECDVVLYDPGISRKHARIFSEGPEYFVEDMGSSNGTKVNGAVVKKRQLADGDAISLGPVVFNFAAIDVNTMDHDGPEESSPGEAPPKGDGSTRIVAASEVKRSKNKGVAMVPVNADSKQLNEMSRSSTKSMAALGRRTNASTPAVRRPNPQGGLSAAERARVRRQGGSFAVFWAEASGATKGAIIAALVLLVGGLVGGGAWVALKGPTKLPPPPEPTSLGGAPIAESFGLSADPSGDGVTYQRADQKIFTFELRSAVKLAVVLIYQSQDVSGDEVIISLNGVDVGRVPADTLDTGEKAKEVLLPSALVKQTEENQIIFDNTRNPPGADPWKIWNLRLEMTPLPELGPAELLSEARTRYKRGQETYDRRDVGARNRWDAYKAFREAWLMTESLPDPKPDLYQLARDKMREASSELDRQCSKLMLEANSHYNQRNFEAARETLEHVNQYFPEPRHLCPLRAQRQRDEWEL